MNEMWTSRFEWYVVNRGYENGRHNGMCLEEVGLRRAQYMLTTLGSTIDVIGRTYATT